MSRSKAWLAISMNVIRASLFSDFPQVGYALSYLMRPDRSVREHRAPIPNGGDGLQTIAALAVPIGESVGVNRSSL